MYRLILIAILSMHVVTSIPTNDAVLNTAHEDLPHEACKENEYWSTCVLGECEPQTCDEVKQPLPCNALKPESCKGGCVCNNGYVRNVFNYCVPISECPRPCKEHEQWSICTAGECDPKTCAEVGILLPCAALSPGACHGGCVCENEYVRNENNVCIHASQCPQKNN